MSDEKKNKKTMVGLGAPSADEIAADAAKKAEEAEGKAEEAEAKAEEAAEAAEAKAEEAADAVEAKAAAAAESAAEAASGADDSDAEDSDADDSDADDSDDDSDADDSDSDDDSDADDSDSDDDSDDSDADDSDSDDDAEDDGGDGDDDDDEDIERRPALYLAQYETPDALHHAACQVRDAGFEKWDCHTPYPVHGLDDAMGLPPTKIGLISFAHAMIGLVTAVLMIQYMNNWDYPIVVGGKPPGAFPSMVPIMFELTVLLTGFGTLFGLLHLAKLPRHHHPIFESDRFAKATDDKFFISIEVQDPKFDMTKTRELLEETEPVFIELVEEELV